MILPSLIKGTLTEHITSNTMPREGKYIINLHDSLALRICVTNSITCDSKNFETVGLNYGYIEKTNLFSVH